MPTVPVFNYPRISDAEAARIEKRIGRPLSPTEVLLGQLKRTPTPQFGPSKFRPRPAAPPEDPFDEELRRAEKAVADEQLAKMSPAERALHLVKIVRAEKAATAEAEVEHAAKLKVFAPQLKQLDKLIQAAAFDPRYSLEEVAQLWNTKEQIESHGACPLFAEEMYAACMSTAKGKVESLRQDAGTRRDELLRAQAIADAEIAIADELLGIAQTQPATPDAHGSSSGPKTWTRS